MLQACPEIGAYGPHGTVGTWRDLMAAAVAVRSMLGVRPSASCEIMGPENAATVMAWSWRGQGISTRPAVV
nr:replication initiation protein RepC [Rhizobium leguminosarum]